MYDHLIYNIGNVQYTWRGWFGCQLQSIESNLPTGYRRNILGEEFIIYEIHGGWNYKIAWTMRYLPKQIDEANEKLNAFRNKLKELP